MTLSHIVTVGQRLRSLAYFSYHLMHFHIISIRFFFIYVNIVHVENHLRVAQVECEIARNDKKQWHLDCWLLVTLWLRVSRCTWRAWCIGCTGCTLCTWCTQGSRCTGCTTVGKGSVTEVFPVLNLTQDSRWGSVVEVFPVFAILWGLSRGLWERGGCWIRVLLRFSVISKVQVGGLPEREMMWGTFFGSRADVRFGGDGLLGRGDVRYKKFSRIFSSGEESW